MPHGTMSKGEPALIVAWFTTVGSSSDSRTIGAPTKSAASMPIRGHFRNKVGGIPASAYTLATPTAKHSIPPAGNAGAYPGRLGRG